MRQVLLYAKIFIGGGIFGWGIDTAYRTFYAGKYSPGTLVPYFSLIYGMAAVMLFVLFRFARLKFWPSIFVGTILCVVLELFGGIVSLSLLDYRLWDYTASPFNFRGFINLEHSAYWFALTFLYRLSYRQTHRFFLR